MKLNMEEHYRVKVLDTIAEVNLLLYGLKEKRNDLSLETKDKLFLIDEHCFEIQSKLEDFSKPINECVSELIKRSHDIMPILQEFVGLSLEHKERFFCLIPNYMMKALVYLNSLESVLNNKATKSA